MKEPVTQPVDLTKVAVLHEAGGRWSVIIADVAARRPRISASRKFTSAEQSSIAAWLESQHVGESLVVVPASAVVCRTFTLPDAPADQLAQGLELQVEAHLNGLAPSHRIAMAVLPAAAHETNRSGLVLAWPESSTVESPELPGNVHFTADVAALAALLGAERPDEPLVWVDRHSEAVALALTHPNGAVLRATREGAADKTALTRGVRRALAETALNAGHSAGFVEQITEQTDRQISNLRPDDAALLLPASLKNTIADRIEGTGADNQWWSDYGIAVGALLARTGELAGLTRMIDAPPIQVPSIVQHAVEKLSQPRIATRVVVVVLLALAISPLLFNGLRLMALKIRHSDLEEKLAAVEQARHSLTMYKELEGQAWSMTKLLSDIGASTPLGIELDIIRLRQGSEFTVAGQASPRDGKSATELVSLMERQLRDSGIFTDIIYTWKEPTANNQYQFDLRAKITRPHQDGRYAMEQDFAAWPHEARRNGDPPPTGDKRDTVAGADTTGAGEKTSTQMAQATSAVVRNNPPDSSESNTKIAGLNPEKTEPATGGDAESRRGNTRSALGPGGVRDDRGMGGIGSRGDDTAGNNPDALPEFLTSSTISTLSRQETIDRLSKVANARKRWKNDEEVMAKLDDQWKLLMDRLKAVPSET